jgi:outer membrane murein-binding lipoprotein Lpp
MNEMDSLAGRVDRVEGKVDALAERVARIDGKVDRLTGRVDRIDDKVDALAASVDARFDEVARHFAEMREYIEFCNDQLRRQVTAAIEGLDGRMASRFDRFERKLDQVIEGQIRSRRPH